MSTDSSVIKRAEVDPVVSAIIPAYEAAEFIAEALDSVFAQTFTGYEVIVVNDGSRDTDALERVLEPYRKRIIYIRQENRGPGGARNTGILKARGEYLAFLDSDDAWLPCYLAEQIRILRADPNPDLIYSDALLFGQSVPAGQTFMQTAPSHGTVTVESLVRSQCSVITSGTVARRQSVIDAGLFDESFMRSEDFDLWLRMADCGYRLSYHKKVIARHRMRAGSLNTDLDQMLLSQIRVLTEFADARSFPPGLSDAIDMQILHCRALLSLEQSKRHLTAGEYAQARLLLEQANSFSQSAKLKVILACLRIAPFLVRFLYRSRDRFLLGS